MASSAERAAERICRLCRIGEFDTDTINKARAIIAKEYAELIKAAQLKRNTAVSGKCAGGSFTSEKMLVGRWVAIPEDDFDTLVAALAHAEGKQMSESERELAQDLGVEVIRCFEVDPHHPSDEDTIRIATTDADGKWQPVLEEGDFMHWALWRALVSSREQLSALRAENERLKEAHAALTRIHQDFSARYAEKVDKLYSAERRVAELKEALTNLLTKMDAIEQHPMFGAVFTIAHIHGTTYDGPNWKDEYDAARALLEADRKLRGEE